MVQYALRGGGATEPGVAPIEPISKNATTKKYPLWIMVWYSVDGGKKKKKTKKELEAVLSSKRLFFLSDRLPLRPPIIHFSKPNLVVVVFLAGGRQTRPPTPILGCANGTP